MNRRGGVDITGECEPTSLKVKVEELVNDEEVELTNGGLPPEATDWPQQLFDQPIPPNGMYHIYCYEFSMTLAPLHLT